MDLDEDINNVDLAQSSAEAESVSDVSSVRVRAQSVLSHDQSAYAVNDSDDDGRGWLGPCQDFKLKIFQLCIDIGLGVPSNAKYAADHAVATYCIAFSDDCKPDYILHIHESFAETAEANNAKVAVLHYLQRFKFLCSPVAVAWDNEGDNAIKSPYIMMEKLPGQYLSEFYYELELLEKIDVALVIAEYMSKMETVTFDRAGALRARDSETQCLPWNSPFSSRYTSPVEIEVGPFRKDTYDELLDVLPVAEEPLHSFLLRILDHRISASEVDGVEPQDEHSFLQEYRIMRYIVKREFQRGNFRKRDTKFFLAHEQLTAEDFLMTKSDDGWKITGVTGWSGSLSLPGVMARNSCEFLIADDFRSDAYQSGWQDWRREIAWGCVRSYGTWDDLHELTDQENMVRTRFFTEMRKRCHNWLDDVVHRGYVRRVAYWVIRSQIRYNDYGSQESFIWEYLYEYRKAFSPAGGDYGQDGPPPGLFLYNIPWDFTIRFRSR